LLQIIYYSPKFIFMQNVAGDKPQKFGITNLSIVIAFFTSLFVSAWEWLKDGKFSFGELLEAVPKLRNIPNVLACFKYVAAEVKDLSKEEQEKLNLLVAEKLEISSKTKAAKITTLVLEALLYLRNLAEQVSFIIKSKDTEEVADASGMPDFFNKNAIS
jgi:hypothetical protein